MTVFALLLGVPTLKLRGRLPRHRHHLRRGDRAVRRPQLAADRGHRRVRRHPGNDYRSSFTDLSPFGDGRTQIGPFDYLNSNWWLHLVAWAVVFACLGLVALLVRSPWGRLLRGVREDEDAMRSLGKNVYAVKMQALVLGGLFGAVGGIIRAAQLRAARRHGPPADVLHLDGAAARRAAAIFGPLLGSILFFAARALVQTARTPSCRPAS